MSGGIAIDTREFDAALRDYLRVTSRSTADAVNGKMRDLLLNAAAYGPFNHTEFSADDYARNRRPEYITFKTVQRFGENPPGSARYRARTESGRVRKRKGNTLGPGQLWNMVMRNKIAARLRKRHSGQRGYMSSAFIKAGLQFAPIGAKIKGTRKKRYFGRNTDGRKEMSATPQKLIASAVMKWNAKSSKDATEKEQLAFDAIKKAYRIVTEDMREYLAKKYEQQAKKNSAAFARAVGKAFA